MIVTFYQFSKRMNSTAQPSGGTEIDVVLKVPTDIYNPTFQISGHDMTDFTYAKWADRYYYITNVSYVTNDIQSVSLSIDPLATWKEDIVNTTAFIKYATSGYDESIPDERLSTKDDVIINRTSSQLFTGYPDGYVVGYIGEQGSASPVVGLSESQLITLQNAIQSSAFAEVLSDPENALSKILSDTASAITSCRYLPKIGIGGDKQVVLAGGYDTGITGKEVDVSLPNTLNIEIPWNFPQNDFRNRAKYTSVLVYLPAYGYAQLNTDDLVGKTSLAITALLDSTVGVVAYDVGGIFKAEADISTPVQISTVTQGNPLGAIVSGAGAIAGIVTGNYGVAGASLFGAVVSSMQTNVGSAGALGSHSSWSLKAEVQIIVISHDTTIEPSSMATTQGRPCMKMKSIDAGYNECVNASVNCNAPDNLKEQINSYLNGGVYIE